MSDRYTAEVLISYDKTIANMAEFEQHLENQKSGLVAVQQQLNTKGQRVKELVVELRELKQELGPIIALEKEYNKILSSSENAIEKLSEQYIEGFKAQKKFEEGKRALIELGKIDKITKEQSTAALRELNLELSLSKGAVGKASKAMDSLSARHIEGAAAVQKLKQQERELNILVDANKMSMSEATAKLNEYKIAAAGATTKIGKLAEAERKAEANMKRASGANKELLKQYNQSTEATKKRSEAIKNLAKLQQDGIISDQRAMELLRRFTLANNEATQAITKLNAGMRVWQGIVKVLHVLWKGFFAVMAVQTLTRWGVEFAKVGENIELMGRKLQIFTKDAQALEKVSEVALRVGVDFEILNKTMTRFAITTKGSFSTDSMLQWTESLVKAGRITGTTTQELRSGLLQLSQAMSAGRLMGDEYRSISENMPLLKQAIEDVFASMGRGNEDLKTLSRNGQITTEVLVESFAKLDDNLMKYGDTWNTIDSALQRVSAQYQIFVHQLTLGNSIFKDLVNGFASIIGIVRESVFGKLSREQEKAVNSGKTLVKSNRDIASSMEGYGEEVIAATNQLNVLETVLDSVASIFFDNAIALDVVSGGYNEVTKQVEDATIKFNGYYALLKGIALGAFATTVLLLASNFVIAKLAIYGITLATFTYAGAVKALTASLFALQGLFVSLIATIGRFVFVLKLAILLNPITAMIAAIATLVTGLVYYVSELYDAQDALTEYNATLLESKDKMDLYKESMEDTVSEMKNFNSEQLIMMAKTNQKLIFEAHLEVTPLENELERLKEKVENNFWSFMIETNDEVRIKELEHRISQLKSAIAVYADNVNLANEAHEKFTGSVMDLSDEFKEMGIPEQSKALTEFNEKMAENSKRYGTLATKIQELIFTEQDSKKLKEQLLLLDQTKAQYLQNIINLTNQYNIAVGNKKDAITEESKLIKKINEEFLVGTDKEAIALKLAKKLLDDKSISLDAYNNYYKTHSVLTKEYIADEKERSKLLKESKDHEIDRVKTLKELNPELAVHLNYKDKIAKQLEHALISEKKYNELLDISKQKYLELIDPVNKAEKAIHDLNMEFSISYKKSAIYAEQIEKLITSGKKLGYSTEKISKLIKEFATNYWGLSKPVNEISKDQKALNKIFGDLKKRLDPARESLKVLEDLYKRNKIGITDYTEAKKYYLSITKEAIELQKKEAKAEQELARIRELAYGKIDPYVNMLAVLKERYNALKLPLSEYIVLEKIILDLQKEQQLQDKCDGIKIKKDCVDELYESYNGLASALSTYAQHEKNLKFLVDQGRMTTEEATRALGKYRLELLKAEAAAGNLGASFKLMWMEFSKGVDENVKGLFSDVLKGEADAWDNFTDRLFDSFADMLADMAYELLKSVVWDFINGNISSSGFTGLLGGLVAGVASLFGGGSSSSSSSGLVGTAKNISSLVSAGGTATKGYSVYQAFQGSGFSVKEFGEAAHSLMKSGASLEQASMLLEQTGAEFGQAGIDLTNAALQQVDTGFIAQLQAAWGNVTNLEMPSINLVSGSGGLTDGIMEIGGELLDQGISIVGDFATSVAKTAMTAIDAVSTMYSAITQQLTNMAVQGAYAIGYSAGYVIGGEVAANAAAEVAATYVAEAIPYIGWVIAAAKLIHMFTSGKKDPPEVGLWSSPAGQGDYSSFGDKDAYGNVDSKYGGVYFSSKHDMFQDRSEQVEEYMEYLSVRLNTLDDAISKFLDSTSMDMKIIEGMKDANLYLDDYRDLETSLDTFMLGRYDKIAEIIGGAFEEGFNIGLDLIRNETDAQTPAGEGFDFINETPKGSSEAAVMSAMLFSQAPGGLQDSFKKLASGITKTTENILSISEAAVLTNQSKLDAEAKQRELESKVGPDDPYMGYNYGRDYERFSEGDILNETFIDAIPKIDDFNTIMKYFVTGTEEAAAGLDELINASQDWINELYNVDSDKQVLNPNYSPSKMGEDDKLIEAVGDKYKTITGQVAKSTTDIILDFIELDNTLTLLGIQTEEFGLVGIKVYKNFMDWAGTIDMAIEKISQLYSVNTLLSSVSVGLFEMSVAGVQAADALVYVYEGFEEGKTAFESFGSAMTNFLDKFGTEEEKLKFLTDSYSVSIQQLNKDFGTTLGTNANHFAYWIKTQIGNDEVDPMLKQGMLSLTDLASSIVNFGDNSDDAAKSAEDAAKALKELNDAMFELRLNVADLKFDLNDSDKTGKAAAIRDLQLALDAFGIKTDASSYSLAELNGWLDHLSTVTLDSAEAYDLASNRATALVKAYEVLDDITNKTIEDTKKFTNSLMELGMTDEEIETKNIKEFFDDVNSFGLSLGTNGEDFGLKGFNAALFDSNTLMFGLESSMRSWGLAMKDTAFTSDMTVDEIIAFTQSLIDSGVNIDSSIESIYNWANSIQEAEVELDDTTDAIDAFNLNMKELYYSLKGETEVDNTIRQIREVFDELDYAGSHASITSSQLANFIIKLDATDDATLDAEESITKLANAIINLDQIVLDATANIESILSDQKMTSLDKQIAAEELRLELAEETSDIQTLTFNEAIAANKKILSLLDDLKISDLNNQSPLEQLNASAKLFKDAVSSGNADDATQYAKDYLKFAQEYYASTSAYSDIFDTVTGSLEGMIKTESELSELPNDDEPTSDWLEELKEQKEILQEQLDNKTFIAQNKELISSVNALALAKDESLFNVIYDKGIDLGSLGPELIGTLTTFNSKTVDDIAKVLQNENTNLESVSNFLGIDFNRLIVLLTEQGYLLKDVVGWDISSLIPDKSLLTPERIIKIAVEQGWSTQVLADQFEVSQKEVKDYIVRELKIPLDSINAWDAQIAADTKLNVSSLKAIGDAQIMATRSEETAAIAEGYGGQFTDNETLHYIGAMSAYGGKGTAEWLSLIAANTFTTAAHVVTSNPNSNWYAPTVGYKQGTNYVPEDQYAFLHKGEAVIPESYNMSNYGVSNKAVQTNDEIVAELRELKEEMRQIKTVNSYGFKENIRYSKKTSDIAQEESERKRV